MRDYANEMAIQSMSSPKHQGSTTTTKYILLLIVGKLFKALGIFLAYDLLKRVDIVKFVFFSMCLASIFFILLQNPFMRGSSTKSLGKTQYIRLFKYSFIQIVIELMWLFGLTLCGPFRATLIFEQSEFVIICALRSILFSQAYSPGRTRGVVVLLTAILIIFGFDFDHINRKVIIIIIIIILFPHFYRDNYYKL